MSDDELQLIREYQGAVQTIVAALRHTYSQQDLLAARRSGEIPQRAAIGGVEFAFHGVGCRGRVGGIEVDFDFGPDGRTDGFDAWRLWTFATQSPTRYPGFQRREDVEAALLALETKGEIKCPRTAPSPHLWYLTT
jgi:hypothetical protein